MGNGKKDITAVIILDLLAAFDTVDHNLLLEVLDKKFSIKDKALHWYEQYLKPRRSRLVPFPCVTHDDALPCCVPLPLVERLVVGAYKRFLEWSLTHKKVGVGLGASNPTP